KYLWIIVITSLSPLVKPQLLILIPLLGFLLFLKNDLSLRQKIIYLLASLVIPVLFYSLVMPFSYGYTIANVQKEPLPLWQYPIAFLKDKQPVGIFMSFWGFFGWLDIPMPKWIYALFLLILFIALIGWGLAIKKNRQMIASHKKLLLFITGVSL